MTRKIIIAIDGVSASGKGTIARGLADYFRFAYLDTGLLYRAIGRMTFEIDANLSPETAIKIAQNFTSERMDDPILRTDHSSQLASQIAIIPEVRSAILDFQRNFAMAPPADGAVLDGRDIGTVICPLAPVKLFVTASPEVRAQRRHRELEARLQKNIDYNQVLQDLKERDTRDMGRDTAPLKVAEDAMTFDTSHVTINEAIAQSIKLTQRIMRDTTRQFQCV